MPKRGNKPRASAGYSSTGGMTGMMSYGGGKKKSKKRMYKKGMKRGK